MSVTVTASTVRPQEILSVLGDYELHHSGGPGSPESRAPPPNPRPDVAASTASANPAGWPTNHRNVPPHRPLNMELDMEERPGGMNVPEQIFITLLLYGTGLNASISQVWRHTVGRVFGPNWFRYDVGGEW